MKDDVVVLRDFPSEIEADIAAAVLATNGIQAQVLRNTAGYPPTVAPARIIVLAEDAVAARELLDTPADPR